jgi:hypothetical protein
MELLLSFLFLLGLLVHSQPVSASSHAHLHHDQGIWKRILHPAGEYNLVPRDQTGSTVIKARADVAGFTLLEYGSLAGFGLTEACQRSLYETLHCHDYARTLGERVYHGRIGWSVGAAVCDVSCKTAIEAFRARVVANCGTSSVVPGLSALSFIDSIWGGWNETCVADPTTGERCNGAYPCRPRPLHAHSSNLMKKETMDRWVPVDDITQMPRDQLCSFCLGAKLRTMQQNPYGVYDAVYQERLDYVVSGISLPCFF